MNAVRLVQALQEIAEESTKGDSILQPGAAYALGCLAHAMEAGPGMTIDELAEAILKVEPRVEWAVEVTWVDWKKAGAKGPTSQYDSFETPKQRDDFLKRMRRDRDIAATRTLMRRAAYTPWVGGRPVPTNKEERERLLDELSRELLS